MRIHMMAVGGTGMGALAGLLKAHGHEVSGCDTALYPPMSDYLARYGINAAEGFDPAHIVPPPDLVVIGNAVHKENPEALACIENGVPYLSMAEAIHRFAIAGRESLVIAGTHGKTTTTAICGYLMKASGLDPTMVVGGIAKNSDSSFLGGKGNWAVLEGDEYETAFFDKGPKFLHYAPSILVLNNIEMDHLDNFRDQRQLEQAFVHLFGAMREDGMIIAGAESEPVSRIVQFAGRKVESFGLAGNEDWSAGKIGASRGGTRFTLVRKGIEIGEYDSPLWGEHNLRNVVAALAACIIAGASVEKLQSALPGFAGVKRRQEVVYQSDSVVVLDDFAHHPTAIAETLKALKQGFAAEKIVACFEPRSYTCQTSLHQERLAASFALADTILLGPFKPSAKIPQNERLDLERVVKELVACGKEAHQVQSYDACFERAAAVTRPGTLVAFFSSGAYGSLPQKLAKALDGRSGDEVTE